MTPSREQIIRDIAETIRPERMTAKEAIEYLQDLVEELNERIAAIKEEHEELTG